MATTGTTAVTSNANEFVLGAVFINVINAVNGVGGNVAFDQQITNTTEQVSVFYEVKSATGAFFGNVNWSAATPVDYIWAGVIATYSASSGSSGGDTTRLLMRI